MKPAMKPGMKPGAGSGRTAGPRQTTRVEKLPNIRANLQLNPYKRISIQAQAGPYTEGGAIPSTPPLYPNIPPRMIQHGNSLIFAPWN